MKNAAQSTETIYKTLGAFVTRSILRALEPIAERIVALESRDLPSDIVRIEARGAAADVERRLADKIADAVAALPKPQDGKSVTAEQLAPLIEQSVQRAVAALPKAEDGTSVTVDDVTPLIERAVSQAVALLPKAKDGIGLAGAVIDRSGSLIVTLSDGTARNLGNVSGKDAVLDLAVIRGMVAAEVVSGQDVIAKKVAALIPAPKNGASVTVDDVEPLITREVSKAVAAIPRPQNGKSVTIEDVRPMVQEEAARIVSEAKAMVRDYVDSRPQPKNGKDVTPEQISEAVAVFLRANPPPAGASVKGDAGRGIGDLLIDAAGNLVATFTDGATKAVGRVVGRDGIDATVEHLGAPELPDVPDDVSFQVSKAMTFLNESPAVETKTQPIVINVNAQAARTNKVITTKRDKSGNLVAHVEENG